MESASPLLLETLSREEAMLERSILTPEEVRVLLRGLPEDEPRLEPVRDLRREGVSGSRRQPGSLQTFGRGGNAAKAAWRRLFSGSHTQR